MVSRTTEPLTVDPDSRSRIERLASRRSREPGGLVREAIDQYLLREERRDEFARAASEAWEQFRADGLHATGAEVDAWLAALEAGEVVDAPECHS